MATKNQLAGAAAEYAVCFRLSMLGWVCAPVRQGAMGIDILASKGCVPRRIQVKGNRQGRHRE